MKKWPSPLSIFAPKIVQALHGLETGLHPGIATLGGASATWPTANLAIYYPVRIPAPVVVAVLWANNGAAVSGNIDVGIYDAAGNLIVSAGSTAQAGVNTLQSFNVADTLIGPGLFYVAVALDNTVGTIVRSAPTVDVWGKIAGFAQQASAFPLPATATFATYAQTYLPIVGFSLRATPL